MNIHEIKEIHKEAQEALKHYNNAMGELECSFLESLKRYTTYLKNHEYLDPVLPFDFIYDLELVDSLYFYNDDEDNKLYIGFDYSDTWGYSGSHSIEIFDERILDTELSDEEYDRLFEPFKIKAKEKVECAKAKELADKEAQFEQLKKELGR